MMIEELEKLSCLYPVKPKCRNKGYTDMDLMDEETKEIFAKIEDLPFPICKKHILEMLETKFQNDKEEIKVQEEIKTTEIQDEDVNQDIESKDIVIEYSVSNEVDVQAMLDAEKNNKNVVINTTGKITTLDEVNTGTYRVITRSGTRHILNFDNHTITRYGAMGHEWGVRHAAGPDAVPYHFNDIKNVRVGSSMSVSNMSTWRLSSTVMSIEKI